MTERQIQTQSFISALPHCAALGMRVEQISNGEAQIHLPYSDALIGDQDTGVIHGGAVSALLDTCAGAAVMCHPKAGLATATLNLRIDYLRSAKPGATIVAHAVCYHVTRTVAFVRVSANDGSSDVPVASGVGAFTVEGGAS